MSFSRPPPTADHVLLTFPTAHILLVTFNRPNQLNSLPRRTHIELSKVWTWYDSEPLLRCAVITGSGRTFCAGANLKEWHEKNQSGIPSHDADGDSWLVDGFGGMSNRRGKKPIIAAVNGHCFGGGLEMMLNSDCVIAGEDALFGLPEVSRGIGAIAGALPRLTRIVGRQRASEMALLGDTYSAKQLAHWGVINKILPNEHVLGEALLWAAKVVEQSPDAIILTRQALLGGWDGEDPTVSTHRINLGIFKAVDGGSNMKEGVLSFVEKRKGRWVDKPSRRSNKGFDRFKQFNASIFYILVHDAVVALSSSKRELKRPN
ncbi:ClpP/crotonase-like domain-containing protein [Dactylonectria estremocensis]|uniref:ClpP/crotonase-like domain-containing protein n=1 Tax=Dactylonectria estremocensis TaxID=1079267 RepID=A0A9P9DS14_9HYPO|nr:ClpP/crotonase-like domain-containing protein [Dactylonectria estremocensis]